MLLAMYHLAPLMDSEGHRRLIGNDVNVLFFLDGPSPLYFFF